MVKFKRLCWLIKSQTLFLKFTVFVAVINLTNYWFKFHWVPLFPPHIPWLCCLNPKFLSWRSTEVQTPASASLKMCTATATPGKQENSGQKYVESEWTFFFFCSNAIYDIKQDNYHIINIYLCLFMYILKHIYIYLYHTICFSNIHIYICYYNTIYIYIYMCEFLYIIQMLL